MLCGDKILLEFTGTPVYSMVFYTIAHFFAHSNRDTMELYIGRFNCSACSKSQPRIKCYMFSTKQCQRAPCRKFHPKIFTPFNFTRFSNFACVKILSFVVFFYIRAFRQSIVGCRFSFISKKSLFFCVFYARKQQNKEALRIPSKCVCSVEVLTYFYCILNKIKRNENVSSKNPHLYAIVSVRLCVTFYYHHVERQQHFHCFTGTQRIVASWHTRLCLVQYIC